MSGHPEAAALFIADAAKAHWHDQAVYWVRQKRDAASSQVPDWEALREAAAAIKAHTLSRLADYLEEFERNATACGATVHFARDAAEHNAIVYRILCERGLRRLVKSKSMLTEECHLNPFLEARGIEVIDTDLGERIVQLAKAPHSHIVMPAIHMKKEEIGQLFHEHLGTDRGASDPKYLTEAARQHLRQKFFQADAGLSGVNFAVAETGGVVVCTNEGNADMGSSLPAVHIACMGVEKLVPGRAELAVFLRLLARSATGQPITTYTTHFHGPRPAGELHIVVVDNGRSLQLGSEAFRRSLSCIRCGACLNTCPVYRRSGGYSYGYCIPGPIGSVLGPARSPRGMGTLVTPTPPVAPLRGAECENPCGAAAPSPRGMGTLPFASTLCGSCTDVCPVGIDLHHQLYALREEVARAGLLPFSKRALMKAMGLVFRIGWLYRLTGWLARRVVPLLPRALVYTRWNVWGRQREIPPMPEESFRQAYRRRHGQP